MNKPLTISPLGLGLAGIICGLAIPSTLQAMNEDWVMWPDNSQVTLPEDGSDSLISFSFANYSGAPLYVSGFTFGSYIGGDPTDIPADIQRVSLASPFAPVRCVPGVTTPILQYIITAPNDGPESNPDFGYEVYTATPFVSVNPIGGPQDLKGYSGSVTIYVQDIPEPSTLALLGLGTLSLLAYDWRRRAAFHPRSAE